MSVPPRLEQSLPTRSGRLHGRLEAKEADVQELPLRSRGLPSPTSRFSDAALRRIITRVERPPDRRGGVSGQGRCRPQVGTWHGVARRATAGHFFQSQRLKILRLWRILVSYHAASCRHANCRSNSGAALNRVDSWAPRWMASQSVGETLELPCLDLAACCCCVNTGISGGQRRRHSDSPPCTGSC